MNEKPEGLDALIPVRLKGTERLRHGGSELPLTVRDFWQWSASDLLSNLARGRFAEFIVAHALRIDMTRGVRKEWDPYDLLTPEGIKVEVKTSAYIQTWRQTALSRIAWSLGPTRAWEHTTNQQSTEVRWQADVYVFALFTPKQKVTTSDPLDLNRWHFFVLPAQALQHYTRTASLTLQTVKGLAADWGDEVGYGLLGNAVRRTYQARRDS